MSDTVFINARPLAQAETGDIYLRIRDGSIVQTGRMSEWTAGIETPQDLCGDIIAPGLIDIQLNGGGGKLFNDDPSLECLEAIAAAHLKRGTTTFLPTLISDEPKIIRAGIEAVRQAISLGMDAIAGIHIEGPCLDQDRKGIHDPSVFRWLDSDMVELLSMLKEGVTLVTLSPRAADFEGIQQLKSRGIRVSLGHSDATYEETKAALNAGASCFTHLYNAMSQLNSRKPGMVGAALNSEDAWASIIADGIHVHPAVLKATFALKQPEKLILISDAMPCVGSNEGSFLLAGEKIRVTDGGCRSPDGTLAGSAISLFDALRYVLDQELTTPVRAFAMATRTPAAFLGLDALIGTLEVGSQAKFLRLDDQLNLKGVCNSGCWVG